MVSYNLTLGALVVFAGSWPGTGSCANSGSWPDWHLGGGSQRVNSAGHPRSQTYATTVYTLFWLCFFLQAKIEGIAEKFIICPGSCCVQSISGSGSWHVCRVYYPRRERSLLGSAMGGRAEALLKGTFMEF